MDGDDDAMFGTAQFTEVDILSGSFSQENSGEDDVDVDGFGSEANNSLRDLVANRVTKRDSPVEVLDSVKAAMEQVMGVGDADKIEIAVARARQQSDPEALIQALEGKVKQLVSSLFMCHSRY